MENFSTYLQKYAELIVKTGVNVQKGQTVVVNIDVEQADLARLIVKEAYKLGADDVSVQWSDDIISREFFEHTSDETLVTIPQYKIDEMQSWVDKGASRISVVSKNPDAFAGIDSDRIANYQLASGKQCSHYVKRLKLIN